MEQLTRLTRADVAKNHVLNMESMFSAEIEKNAKDAIVYTNEVEGVKNGRCVPEIDVEELDSVGGIAKHYCDDICVLNFASYRYAGGGFIMGSMAQEECLCHESTLYNTLVRHQEFYDWNAEHTNNGLYMNRAIYSKEYFKINDEFKTVRVLTCAAPNFSTQFGIDAEEANSKALEERIKFIVDILKVNRPKTVILGAFGCGVFSQNPYEVAELFKKHLVDFDYPINVYFDIVGTFNYEAFKSILKDEEVEIFKTIEI